MLDQSCPGSKLSKKLHIIRNAQSGLLMNYAPSAVTPRF